jgi:hypothetical protein
LTGSDIFVRINLRAVKKRIALREVVYGQETGHACRVDISCRRLSRAQGNVGYIAGA